MSSTALIPVHTTSVLQVILYLHNYCVGFRYKYVKCLFFYGKRKLGLRIFILKSKAVPLQAWSGPEGSRKLSFPEFITTV
jgi:hypothetical protein